MTALFTHAAAAATEVDLQCAALSPQQAEELGARVRLTLGTCSPAKLPQRIEFQCDGKRVWVHWVGPPTEKLVVRPRAGLVEGALDALEQRLSAVCRTAAQEQREHETTRAQLPERDPSRKANVRGRHSLEPDALKTEPAVSGRKSDAGGLALALTAEPRPGTVAFGPKAELAVGAHKWAGVVSQAARWDPDQSTLLWDSRLGLSWGAPSYAHLWYGAILSVGMQGLSVIGRDPGPGGDANASAPQVSLGLRAAQHPSALALWTGVDAGWRLRPLNVGRPFNLSLPRWTVTLSVGVMWRVDAAEPR